MLNRRGFLGSLFGAAAIALDPEKALWLPSKKLISIPKPAPITIATEWSGSRLKIGDTILVRKPMRFVVRDGPGYIPESITDRCITFTVTSESDLQMARSLTA